jgi:multidrug efflux pump subunit AcrB
LLAIAAVCLPIVVLGDVAGLEILYPMGIAVLGGLVSVALVSLIATPVLYSLLGGRRTEAGVL